MDNQRKIADFFNEFNQRVEQAMPDILLQVANEGVNYTLEAFQNQAWDGQPWDKRADKKDTGRSILVLTGRLRQSIRVIRSGQYSISYGTDVPYAEVHNNGGLIKRAARSETFVRNRFTRGAKGKMFGGMGAFKKGTTSGQGLTFKAYELNMPKRQFIGVTPELTRRAYRIAGEEFNRILKSI